MSWLTTLFGGSKTTQTSTPLDMTPGEFKDLRDPFASALQQWQGSGGPAYEGPMFSPETMNEQLLRGDLMGDAAGTSGRQQLLSDTMTGKYADPASNPFLKAYIEAAQRPTMEALETALGRTLPGRFNLAGHTTAPQGSSAFDRAAALATKGAADAMGDIATKIGFGAYEGERTRQQQAIQLSQAEVDTTIKNLQAQSLPRMIQELGIERGMQEFNRRTQALLEVLKLMGGVTAPTIANQTVGKSETSKGIFPALFPQGMKLPS